MEIDPELSSVGTTHYEHQTSVQFTIDGEEYWFTVFAKGSDTGSNEIDYDIDNDDDIPFELTQEIKDELIDEFLTNEANFR
jgi:hypothetical protein